MLPQYLKKEALDFTGSKSNPHISASIGLKFGTDRGNWGYVLNFFRYIETHLNGYKCNEKNECKNIFALERKIALIKHRGYSYVQNKTKIMSLCTLEVELFCFPCLTAIRY